MLGGEGSAKTTPLMHRPPPSFFPGGNFRGKFPHSRVRKGGSMSDFSSSAMIALLPTTSDWCFIELPHMTLVYAGEITNTQSRMRNELAKEAVSISMGMPPLTLVVLGLDVFGDNEEEVEVLVLRPDDELLAMRKLVESWNASEHIFTPHVTVGPIGSVGNNIPDSITFDRIAVGWGDELIQFNLTREG